MITQYPTTTSGMFDPSDLSSGKKLLDGASLAILLQWTMSVSYGNTALAGGTVTGAPIINAGIYEVDTVANAADSIALPFGIAGLVVRVFNQTATSLTLWPQIAINPATGIADVLQAVGGGVILSQAIAGHGSVTYFCIKPGLWKSTS